MNTVLVVAPHPDDETLGCGGSLLQHQSDGDAVHWLIVTDMLTEQGFDEAEVDKRQTEIERVASAYRFAGVHRLGLPTASLDQVPRRELVEAIGRVVGEVSPSVVYVPFRGDVHTDHSIVFDAAASCTKWFRYPSIRRVLCYETLSETDFGLEPNGARFNPNSFMDITAHLDRKIEIAKMYEREMGEFPFPRSEEALRSLALLRGAACGCAAAESFMLLKEIVR